MKLGILVSAICLLPYFLLGSQIINQSPDQSTYLSANQNRRLSFNFISHCASAAFIYEAGKIECIQTFEDKKLPNKVITVGSYNVYGFRELNALKKDLSRMPDVSIWAFQEVYGYTYETVPAKLLQVLPDGKWYLYIQLVNKENDSIWEGQVIASRYPFRKAERLPLEHSNPRERAALVAHFSNFNGTPFLFINTDHEVALWGTSFADRKKQLQSLLNYTSLHLKASILITGDMNTTGGDEEIQLTENFMAKGFFNRALPLYNDRITFENFFVVRELDHVFFKNLISSKRFKYAARSGSDHFPIYVDIQL